MPTDHDPADITDLPLQPTGSGVTDTELAIMQAEIADADGNEDDRPAPAKA